MPSLSVLVPVFNQPEGALKSLQAISHFIDDWPGTISVLLSDNASDDVQYQIGLRPFIEAGWLTVFQQRENLGVAGNVRFLAHQAEGEYAVVLGCGDRILEPQLLEALKAIASLGTPPDLVVASVIAHVGDSEPIVPLLVETDLVKFSRLLSLWVPYQEALPGQIYFSRTLKACWPVIGRSGSTWPHLELSIRLALESNAKIFRYAHPIVSMHQTLDAWYSRPGANIAAIIEHLRILRPALFFSTAFALKFLILLAQGIPSALRQDRVAASLDSPNGKTGLSVGL